LGRVASFILAFVLPNCMVLLLAPIIWRMKYSMMSTKITVGTTLMRKSMIALGSLVLTM